METKGRIPPVQTVVSGSQRGRLFQFWEGRRGGRNEVKKKGGTEGRNMYIKL